MLIPSKSFAQQIEDASLSRRVNANSQLHRTFAHESIKLIKKGEC